MEGVSRTDMVNIKRYIHGDFFGSANFDDKKRAVNGTYYSGMISFVGNLC